MNIEAAAISNPTDLAEAFDALRGHRTYQQLTSAAQKLPPRQGRRPALPRSTISDLLKGRSVPSKDTVITFLQACGLIAEQERRPWLDAWERVGAAHLRHPATAVRVSQARPQLLGVHRAIRVRGAVGEVPAYVPRDFDPGLREEVEAAAAQGGFVLLVGGSSAGKTRSLFEAVRETLPEWWLLYPADADAIRALAAAPTQRTVLWLDDLQHYLDRPGGLPAAAVRDLVNAGAVVVATLWRHEYAARTDRPDPDRPDQYGNDRQLLGLAHVVDVPDTFSGTELDRAEEIAGADARLRIAVDAPDAGVTQVLAGGPQLVERWNGADAYARAVLAAAVDAARLGMHSPIPPLLLRDAAPGYCTDVERAQAPDDWFERAMACAGRLVLGAVAPLAPVADGISMGVITGYRLAAYLLQHARVERARDCPPAAFWEACLAHVSDRDDLERLGYAADRRMRYRYAIRLLRRSATRDDYLAERLGRLLFDQGYFDEALSILRGRAEADPLLARRLPVVEAGLGHARVKTESDTPDEGGFGHHAENGDISVAYKPIDILAVKGRFDDEMLRTLHMLVDGGLPDAESRLIAALVEAGESVQAHRLARFGLTADGQIDSRLALAGG